MAREHKKNDTKEKSVGTGITLGLVLGVVFGIAVDDLVMGIALGISFGAAFRAFDSKKIKSKGEKCNLKLSISIIN